MEVQNQYNVWKANSIANIFSRSSTSTSSRSKTLCSYRCSMDSSLDASNLFAPPWALTESSSFLSIAEVLRSKTNSSDSNWFFSNALVFCCSNLKMKIKYFYITDYLTTYYFGLVIYTYIYIYIYYRRNLLVCSNKIVTTISYYEKGFVIKPPLVPFRFLAHSMTKDSMQQFS